MFHAAVEDVTVTHQRECRVCGRRVVGFGPDARHEGEPERFVAPAREDLPAFRDATDVAAGALRRLDGEQVPPEQAGRVVVMALYQAGLLRRTKKPPG